MIKIKDKNFLKLLQTKKFKSALRNEEGKPDINGQFIDENSPTILGKTKLDIRSSHEIEDLSGIEYFVNVETLKIDSYSLTTFPKLPPNLKELNIKYLTKIKKTPVLPASIKNLSIYTQCEIGVLPDELLSFTSTFGSLDKLPELPLSLKELHCNNNNLKSLPPLPEGLEILNCFENRIKKLPPLPEELKKLNCSNNKLKVIALSEKLEILHCSDNKLEHIGPIPDTLKECFCDNNNFSKRPSFPKNTYVYH